MQKGARDMGIIGLRKFLLRMGKMTACLHALENDSIEKEKLVILER